VACTHLKSKPPHEARRVVQIKQLIEHLLSMQGQEPEQHAKEPIVLTGDFNADVGNDVYNTASMNFDSAYLRCHGEEPEYTTCKVRKDGEACHTIDYIFVSKSIQVIKCLSIPKRSELPTERIPSWGYPSDHLSIGADLEL
tara:strand:- start:129 stop:551 length:423 start_codon:yes stop_codon:yes gene_type:complete